MRRGLLTLACVLVATGAFAQPPDDIPHKGPPGRMMGPGVALLERLNRMSPEERRRLLESLPPERRRRLEERLARYNQMTPEERRGMQDRFREFHSLPPERQEAMRQVFRRLSELPEDRRFIVHRAARRLQFLPPEERAARMSSEAFRSRFSPAEQQLIEDLAKTLPPPPRPGGFYPPRKKGPRDFYFPREKK